MTLAILFADWSDPSLVAAVVAAATALATSILATPLRYVIDKRALRHRLKTEYEYEQRKELRQLIGRYHGRLLEAADNWHHRMRNLYTHEHAGWLDVGGRYADSGYYFRSTVYRFLVLCTLARRFEAEAFYIDARIAEKTDLDFVKFVRAFRWALTDLELVAGVPYDFERGTDHFFNDRLRGICDACLRNGEVFSFAELEGRLDDETLAAVLEFFDGLRSGESRLRWDRLVALHLLVMAFLNVTGYEMQRSGDEDFARTARRFRNPEVLANLGAAIPRLGLATQPEARRIEQLLAAGRGGHGLHGRFGKRPSEKLSAPDRSE